MQPEKKTIYYKDGSVSYERYYIDGKLHRVDGPASIDYYEDGSVWYEGYWLDDDPHWKEDYEIIIKEAKKLDKANQLLDPRAWVRELGRTS